MNYSEYNRIAGLRYNFASGFLLSISSPWHTQSFTWRSVFLKSKFLFPKQCGWMIFGILKLFYPFLHFPCPPSQFSLAWWSVLWGRCMEGGKAGFMKTWDLRRKTFVGKGAFWREKYFFWSTEKFPLDWEKTQKVMSVEDLCWLSTAPQGCTGCGWSSNEEERQWQERGHMEGGRYVLLVNCAS